MNPMNRTLIYVGVAVVSVSLAIWKGLPTPEINPQAFANVGEPFFPDFENPNDATGIRVVIFNPDTAEQKSFEVKNQGGEWKIPSHYNYPADGKDQLTKTAASLVAVRRGVVAGESEIDFERLGVVDPASEDSSKLRGRGERLTLTKDNNVLLDLIIGNKVENQSGYYYVRKPDEKLTFIAQLDLELSTKFNDWIEPDLLQVNTTDLRAITIKDYFVDEASRRIVMRDVLELNRPDSSTPWKLEKLEEETEELKTAEVNSMITTLDELKIVGVRPKPPGVSADLKLSGEVQTRDLSLLDLQAKGYYVVPTKNGLELFANEGDLEVVTSQGVQYVLRFGEVFTGSEFDIEVGSAAKGGEEAADAAKDEATDANANSSDLKQSRYLFVTVAFNEKGLGPAPVKPTPPEETKPEETKPEETKPEETKPEETKPEDAEATVDPTAEPTTEKQPEAEPKEDPRQVYEAALKKYEEDLARYEQQVEAGQQRVAELNARFADWYYVIDAASFDKLHKTRADLVEMKEPPAEPKPTTPEGTTPSTSADEKPGSPAAQPELKAPSTEKPAETPEKPAEKPAPEAGTPEPASESKPVEKPAPATEPTPEPAGTEPPQGT